ELDLTGLGRLYICPLQDRVTVLARYEGTPDTRIKATPIALAELGRGGDTIPEGIEVEGDTEVAQTFRQTLAAVEIDWEDLLSKGLGDIAAHQIGNFVRGFKAWAARAGDSTMMNTSEYLQEESRLLPTREEVELFMSDVATLRDDVERLAARVERLAKKKIPPAK
ncbi:MAG: ubiquinone biosynthesis accessory factor UbiJ, partial [Gammaproteobacteria bacterium]